MVKSFSQFILEANYGALHKDKRISDLKKIVKGFIVNHPIAKSMIVNANKSKGYCETISKDLAEYMVEEGMEARAISCAGFKKDLGTSPAAEWEKFRGQEVYFWHCVVKVGDWFVDLTGSQFGKEYGGVRILDRSILESEWMQINEIPESFGKHLPQSAIKKYFKEKKTSK